MMQQRGGGRDRRESLDDDLAALQQQDDMLSDDDNAAPDIQADEEETEDPLMLAMEDLEGRVVTALDDVKMHPGVRSSAGPTVHEELATLLRAVIEVAAHTGPSVARTYYSPLGAAGEGIEASCQDVYERLVSDLVLPVLLEMAQSDTIPAKRVASLEFFHNFWKEIQKAGSWLDTTSTGPTAGPHGSGGGGHALAVNTPALRAQEARRKIKRLTREGEILRYWVQASIACTLPGVFTSLTAEDSVASRGVIAASASLRPCLRHIAQRIEDADDRGANRVYGPVMKMVEGVMKKLFVKGAETGEALRGACIKFLEIVVLCCSSKGLEHQGDKRRRVSANPTEDFSLEDFPPGHPIITREALESIAEYAFTALRGFLLMGGQVKIDENFQTEEGSSGSPSEQVVAILKPATLAFLALETSVAVIENEINFKVDRANTEMEFLVGHKSYALTINAISMLATHRPMFYKEAATCLARRTVDPPPESPVLAKAASVAIAAHLRASCLTLLRNALSVTTNGHEVLHKALSKFDMTLQADKALKMATQTAALKTAGRAARNRAAMFYEWDDSEDKRTNKRQRETDDALAKMRAAKAAKGLGNGIQLPTSMVDSVELILLNLTNLPSKRPISTSERDRKRPVTFDYVVDAVMTNGASLSEEDGQWYERDGGSSWIVDLSLDMKYTLEGKTLLAGEIEHRENNGGRDAIKDEKMPLIFQRQCQTAASQALNRIVQTSSRAKDQGMADFGSRIAARISWTLKHVTPKSDLKDAHLNASESVLQLAKKRGLAEMEGQALSNFVNTFPLVSACLSIEVTETLVNKYVGVPSFAGSSIVNSVLNEGYMASCKMTETDNGVDTTLYKNALDIFAVSVVHASDRANEKPNDNERKQAAAKGAATLTHQLSVLPSLTPSSLRLLCGLCDIGEISKKATDLSKKTSQHSLAESAATHAAKVAAEKRATAALVALRDVAFQRTHVDTRKVAVECAVAIAGGRYPSSPSIEDKALKLVMNVLFPKSDLLATMVLDAATIELTNAAHYAIENHDEIQMANKETTESGIKSSMGLSSEKEKVAIDHVKKPAILFMALCVRRPDMIQTLMSVSCQENANVLSKAVRANMPKLARAVATKHGAATIALEVASMAGQKEIPMVLAFLENLTLDKSLPPEELIEACHKIQDSKLTPEGKKDPRFIIPVVSGMKQVHLVEKLPEFVAAEDNIFMAALVRMADRVTRQALLFRNEPDPSNPILTGMTLCEQLVFLHRMDFAALGLPQKRYLVAIRNCLEDDTVFTDRVVMAAMDYISGVFLSEKVELPLAYMRTIMLVCSKHESLHNWICHVLLPRLIEGEVYQDRRQWEGWMRCARMLEKPGESGVSSLDAIRKLPPDQLQVYRAKYPNE